MYEDLGGAGAIWVVASVNNFSPGGYLASYGDTTTFTANLKSLGLFSSAGTPPHASSFINGVGTTATAPGAAFSGFTWTRFSCSWSTPTLFTYINNVATDAGA
jgi:hypothetical protein